MSDSTEETEAVETTTTEPEATTVDLNSELEKWKAAKEF